MHEAPHTSPALARPPTIGPHRLRNPFILAPMASVSEMPFRRIALEMGAALAPTELVSSAGLMRLSARTLRYLRYDPQVEKPFCVQLFGGKPDEMAEAAAVAAEWGAQIIDINMGCPVPKVTRNGAGSALMCDPERAAEMVSGIGRRTGLPVTVKLRAGWDHGTVNAPEVARRLVDAGAVAVAIHPRTRAQGYTGKADWSLIARIREKVGCTLIGNGDVASLADARRMMRETGCDAVMVGRAALGNPWIFRELTGGAPAEPSERAALIRRHITEHLEHYGDERRGLRSFRKMLLWYAHGLRGAVKFRRAAMKVEDLDELLALIDDFFEVAEPADGGGEREIDYRTAYG